MTVDLLLAATGDGISRAERAQGDTWSVDHHLRGTAVSCLASDPLAPTVFYAGAPGVGLLRSRDRGLNWETVGTPTKEIRSIAASRSERGTIYAGTKPAAIFVSRDDGSSWSELESFRKIPESRLWFSPAEPPFTAYVQALAISPEDPDVILAGIEAGAVVRTMDGGRSWSGHRKGALRDCHSLCFHASAGGWSYEGGGSGVGASFSRDEGASWSQTRRGLDRHYGWACAAHPGRPEVWYVSASTSPFHAHSHGDARAFIFRKDGDRPWQKVSGGLSEPLPYMPYALLTDPNHPEDLWAGLSSGEVYHSRDRGESWRKLPLDLGGIHRTMILGEG